MNKILLISLLSFIFDSTFAQNKYLILLKDKNSSPFSIERPQEFLSIRSIERRNRQKIKVNQRDLPPNPAYINQIKAAGSKIWYQSRWLNAVLIETSPTVLNTILALPFVKGLEGSGDIRNARIAAQSNIDFTKNKLETLETPLNYGNSFNQIEMLGVDKMHDAGFKGEGMLIGVFDSGFLNANKVSFLSSLFTENRILKTWDFVSKESNVYDDHNHGLNVLSCIAGVADGQLIGTAPKANFVLFKTEDVASETRIEEANWLFAAEMADSIVVDVVNS